MRSVLGGFTVRGQCFLAAGAVGALGGLILGNHALASVGFLLAGLPLVAALTAQRARYQHRCERTLSPARVPPGKPARVTLRLENVTKVPTGLMLAEDQVPYALGVRPRYVLNAIERGGSRDVSYLLRSDLRGRFVIGPMSIRIADVFGLVELSGTVAEPASLTVTPKVVPLGGELTTGSWSGDGDGRTRVIAAAGDDDVIPRPYHDGDELRRVHWRSTARYGELMVRREEQRWKNRAFLLLDTRRVAHEGSGVHSSFEFAVSAAASIGAHVAHSGLGGALISDAGLLAGPGMFEDVMLDALAVILPSRNTDFHLATPSLCGAEGGLLIVVAGRLSEARAREIAVCRREGSQGMALLLDVGSWGDLGQPDRPEGAAAAAGQRRARNGSGGTGGRRPARPAESAETVAAAVILRRAGWRVTTLDASTGLDVAWQRLGVPGSGSGMANQRVWRPAVPR